MQVAAHPWRAAGVLAVLCICAPPVRPLQAQAAPQNGAGPATNQDPRCELLYSADPKNVPDAVARLKAGEYSATYVDMVRRAHATEAIPSLEREFDRQKERLDLLKIASVLVSLGDRNGRYWDYLVREVRPAVEDGAPFFMNVDKQGHLQPGPSPAFLAWAERHKATQEDIGKGEQAVYLEPGEVALLGMSGDPRAVPLLRRALQSPNYFVQRFAAEGLATLKDEGSIPLIIAVVQRAPAELAPFLAETLVPFPDPNAEAAVDRYVPKDRAKSLRDDLKKPRTVCGKPIF